MCLSRLTRGAKPTKVGWKVFSKFDDETDNHLFSPIMNRFVKLLWF